MKTKIFLCSLISLFALACDHIDENERLIYVEPETVQRTVLLEDFTGQQCVNCPKGTEVIEQLQQAYGDGIIAVGIHGGPLGFKGNATTLGLATDLGDEYYNHWSLEYQPVGLINRHGTVNYTDWMTKVIEEMKKPSTIDMSLDALLSGNQITITVSEWSIGAYDGKLQIWVLEDSITATQTRHDPIDDDNVTINDKNYVHNHVLRAAINSTSGDNIALRGAEGDNIVEHHYKASLKEGWKPQDLSVVAFVCNDSEGVLQVVSRKLKTK